MDRQTFEPDTCVDSTSVLSMHECPVKWPKGDDFTKVSPRSPLSTGKDPPFRILISDESDFFDLILDGTMDASIEQMYLYRNVCEMQSSDHSPSRSSFISYGEESRIDSELRFLAGGGMTRRGDIYLNEQDGENRVDEDRVGKTSLRPHQRMIGRQKKDCHGGEGYLGPYLLKQARDVMVSGNNSRKALELATRAMKAFEASSVGGTSSLALVMCLHVVAALYCMIGSHAEAIPVLEQSIEIPVVEVGLDHAVAKFAGCMQLGDTYASVGRIKKAIAMYLAGLEIQRCVLGEKDSRYGDTCRYVAEAYVEALQFDEAERLCSMAIDIHKNGTSGCLLEAEDRWLMGLILDAKGDYGGALDHYLLVRTAMAENACDADAADVECIIGDGYTSLGRYDEAVAAYRKALKTVKLSRENIDRLLVASIFIRLANLCYKTGHFAESKSYCENAVKIYSKPMPGMSMKDIANGFVEVSCVFASIDEHDRAIGMLQKAMDVYGNAPGDMSMVFGIEAQMGALYYMRGRYRESYECLKKVTERLRTKGDSKTVLYGMAMNQMGLACLRLVLVDEAKDAFEEARNVLESECGTYHADTLGVYGNLAGTYDAMGQIGEAIQMMEYVVKMRETRLGKGNPGVEEEKRKLHVLMKESRSGKHKYHRKNSF